MNIKNIPTEFLPIVSDEEILLISSDYISLRKNCDKFDFNSFSDVFCKRHFRFHKQDILKLVELLELPNSIKCSNGIVVSRLEGFCVMLKRLAYPHRYCDMMFMFPRTTCELSRIFNKMIQLVMDLHSHRLKSIDQNWLTLDQVKTFAESIHQKGAPYKSCFGFLDGTIQPVCRPTRNQKLFYNGHKRVHAIKFQSCMHPNGIISQMHGPVSGRRHDAHVLMKSGILQICEAKMYNETGEPYYLYGDPAYPLREHLMVPFKGNHLNQMQRQCNKQMSKVRICVEWGFGNILQNFAFLGYKKNLKLMLQPVANYYLVGTLLTNCIGCLYGNTTSTYFNCPPPTLEEYLQ